MEMTIRIYDASEGGYMYDIYRHDHGEGCDGDNGNGCDSEDGGLCTTTMLNALGMAASQAETLIKKELGDECPGCGVDLNKEVTGRYAYYPDEEPSENEEPMQVCKACSERNFEEGDFIGER